MQWSAKNVVRSKTHRTSSGVTQRKYKLCSVKLMELCKCGEGPAICANGQGPVCCGRVNREPGPVQRRRISAVIFM